MTTPELTEYQVNRIKQMDQESLDKLRYFSCTLLYLPGESYFPKTPHFLTFEKHYALGGRELGETTKFPCCIIQEIRKL